MKSTLLCACTDAMAPPGAMAPEPRLPRTHGLAYGLDSTRVDLNPSPPDAAA